MVRREKHKMIIGKIFNTPITTADLNLKDNNKFSLDSVVRTAILTIIAGYLERDDVEVAGQHFFPKRKLNQFLSYILNDKQAAPKNFQLNITFNEKEDNKYNEAKRYNDFDCLISFSGGIDSTAGIMYALDKGYKVQPVWIGFGQKNEKSEIRIVRKLCKSFGLNPLIIKINLNRFIDQTWARWKMGIIPARNYLFASVAAQIASQSAKADVSVYICAHKEEIYPESTDKSHRFFNTSTLIFSEAYQKNIKVTTPFYKFTKPEIVSYWEHYWKEKYKISPRDTSSCYFGNNCGVCKACINRAVAFSCAGIDMEIFKVHPFFDKGKLIQNGYIGRFDSLIVERKLDFLSAMDKNKKFLSKNLKNFLDVKTPIYKDMLKKRQKTITNVVIT